MPGKEVEFNVMSFNLRFGLAEDGKNAWARRKNLVEAVFHRHPSTFIGFQESNHFQTRFLIDCLKNHNSIGWHNASKERWQSNLIFYDASWKCIHHKHYFLSDTPEIESKMGKSKWPRQCVVGLFEKDAFQIIVANTHFDFNALVQQKSAKLVHQFLSEFPNKCPAVITGDFNSNHDSLAWRFFLENGFHDAFEGKHATTFHEFRGKKTHRHIDWILYRNGLKILDAQIIKDNDNGQYPSDHYPVTACFSN